MRASLSVLLATLLMLGTPWRAALADDGLPPTDLVGVERFGQFSHVPEPYAGNDASVCPECIDLQADAGGGGASSSSGWLVVALIVIVVIAASSSDSGGGGGY